MNNKKAHERLSVILLIFDKFIDNSFASPKSKDKIATVSGEANRNGRIAVRLEDGECIRVKESACKKL